MKKRRVIKDGDLFIVRLGDNSLVVGIVLHSSRYFKTAILVSFFNHVYNSTAEIDLNSLPSEFIVLENGELPNYTGKSVIYSGVWEYFGNSKDLLPSISIPKLRSGRSIFVRDEIIDDKFNDIKEDGPILGLGYEYIENLLRKHFGL